ncbi:hypothetical protein ACNFBT_17265 [Pseudomonas sp. NY15181]|uniref:hypothetical protein n=1 Tax=Pseudomonas sp. NY15181 TaxID=3400349 RepID=UPI003A83A496
MSAKAANQDKFSAAKAKSDAKLSRLRKSSSYKSFCSQDAVEAFAEVSGSGYAGKSQRKPKPSRDNSPSC